MCVILCANERRLTPQMVEDANRANPDGLGLAWIERGAVRWRKGLSLRDAKDIVTDVPVPYVLHARWATVGGVTPALCHPFPINLQMSPALTGRARSVLFHNGHWAEWTRWLDAKRPAGAWSDSRGMAWLSAIYGQSVLEEIAATQKLAVLNTRGITLYGHGWKELHGGAIFASNLNWMGRSARSGARTTVISAERVRCGDAVLHRLLSDVG